MQTRLGLKINFLTRLGLKIKMRVNVGICGWHMLNVSICFSGSYIALFVIGIAIVVHKLSSTGSAFKQHLNVLIVY